MVSSHSRGSSNGRTSGSGPDYRGSSPCPRTMNEILIKLEVSSSPPTRDSCIQRLFFVGRRSACHSRITSIF